jgi:hypothetical protein
MRRIAPLLIALAVGAPLVSVAQAATDPALPPAGAYAFSDVKGGFTVNAARTQMTGIHFSFTSGMTGQCTEQGLPDGKLTATIAAPQKLVAAHRGGYTSYIVGRSTPSTSNGVTAIPMKYRTSPGGKQTGTMYLIFQYDKPRIGGGEIIIDGCTLVIGFHKR